MKKGILSFLIISFSLVNQTFAKLQNEPESGYLFAYATERSGGRNGLHFAWSRDKENWFPIGPEHSYVRSDYSRWGSEKRMIAPYLIQGTDGIWHCIWGLNEREGTFAIASSEDLVNWKRQSYPIVGNDNNCLIPFIMFDENKQQYIFSWISDKSGNKETYYTTSANMKTFTPAEKSDKYYKNDRQMVHISGKQEIGTIHKVDWTVIDGLIKGWQLAVYKNDMWSETTANDANRYASLKPVDVTLSIQENQTKPISDLLIGIFFEDISYAADGGLYAELIQNRGFEYSPEDKEGHDKEWNNYKSWILKGEGTRFTIDTLSPIHSNNPHYAILQTNETGAVLQNEGFDGIPVKAGEKYNFSVFARTPDKNKKQFVVRLTGDNGKIYGETSIKSVSSEWKKYEVAFTSKETATNAKLEIIPQTSGTLHLDMISLFPAKTFKNRKNGLRADLAQIIADMNPRFVRFPGGCVAHGDGLHNMYRWKNTVGPLEARVPQRNIWGYHQTAGLGYFEYFQFCEDIGAEPVPVVPAGVPCQNSKDGGQQGGIPMCEMDDYVQEVLDLIEYANGSTNTAWGKKRAEAGHPKPFNLKYVGIGNEDQITDVFEERFTMLYNAVKEKHPEITVIGTVGPFCEGTDYVEGWDIATRLQVPMVDEHYYQTPGWFINNQDYYDRYDRNKSKVYLGEYAAHLPGRPNNIETALAEALHLANIERNGDIVTMTSYAPLLAKEGHINWNPDLIYFNNTEVKPTVGYHVQKLYGQNAGDKYISHTLSFADAKPDVKKRIVTSIVQDSKSNDIILKLVNMLPVEVNTQIDMSGLGISPKVAKQTVLSGNPGDKKAVPAESMIEISNNFTNTLPPYSFTVIRIPGK